MATRFDTLVDAVVAQYQADTGDTSTAHERGARRLAENSVGTRVVWIRDGGQVAQPQRLGPQTVSGRSTRPVRSRVERVTAVVFTAAGPGRDESADNGAAEAILDGLIGAVDAVLETALVGQPEYAWFTETDEGADWASNGAKVALEMAWRVGVARGSMQVVYPKTFTATTTQGRGDFANDFSADFRRIGGEAA